MTKKIIWRLREQPTAESLRELVKDTILTKEEARQILFNYETEDERDKKSLESEIKFLREIIEKLSTREEIIKTITIVEKPKLDTNWYKPYQIWCNYTTPSFGTITCDANIDKLTATNTFCSNFSSIKTF
jgi:hypothetical protein